MTHSAETDLMICQLVVHTCIPPGGMTKFEQYYRLHGVPELYKSPYSPKQLEKIADEIAASGKTKKAYVYFNNDIGGSALKNAKEMMAYCLSQKVTGN